MFDSLVCVCVAPLPVQVAVPLSVGPNYTQLYYQPPRVGVIDGLKVCVCLGACSSVCTRSCGYRCDWHSLPAGVQTITIGHLSPGSQYQLTVYSTSGRRTGPPYYTHPIRTGGGSVSVPKLILPFSFTQQRKGVSLSNCSTSIINMTGG